MNVSIFFDSVIYLFKHLFSEKMMPHDLSTPPSPALDPEEVRSRKMNRRAKVIQELVQTEGDYLKDLELCIQEVVQPLRNLQVHYILQKVYMTEGVDTNAGYQYPL